MMTKLELNIITNMCYTYQHDYGLLKEEKQKAIFKTMEQIFINDIKPKIKELYKEGSKK